MRSRLRFLFSSAAAFLIPALAWAHPGHPGHEVEWDFQAGAVHPLSGLDHVLAMVAIGLWAAQLGGRARWLVPSAFVAMMVAGGVLGRFGGEVPALEQAIAASAVILGLLIALAIRPPVILGMVVAGTFALFHGYAHGAEMPENSSATMYVLGFVAATITLHLVGLGLGLAASRLPSAVSKVAGWAVAACGIYLFAV
ncbi:MAG TPA: HupE/UreJ family protein [Candidatus Didemnitutus sp.]|nr:HupE/UreJ family protein [Candidatus Didemnitutus sp.]